MNFPEMTTDIKHGQRSESVVNVTTVDKPPSTRRYGGQQTTIGIGKLDGAKADKQSKGFSRESLDSLIAETEKQLEANDVKLKFNVLEEADTVQVEVVDGNGKTIRKIPEDDLLKLSKSLKNLGTGFLDEVS